LSEEGRNDQEGRRVCSNCGAELPHETTNFCPSCGAAQSPDPEVPTGPPPGQPEAGRISTEYAPGVPPPPPQAGGGSRRWIFFVGGGCLVLLVLVLLGFAGCFALLSNSGGGGGSTSGSSNAEDSKAKQAAVDIGTPITVGDVTWTVPNARQENQLVQQGVSQKNAKTEQGDFVIVEFDFMNNGSEAVTLDTESLALIDSEGRESKPSPDTSLYVPQDRRIFLERINPGVTRPGEAIFEVAPGSSGFQLQAGDAKMFTDENGYVNLGF
jgi:hypothetical protein